eukprot:930843-Rhodomonas_salina.2
MVYHNNLSKHRTRGQYNMAYYDRLVAPPLQNGLPQYAAVVWHPGPVQHRLSAYGGQSVPGRGGAGGSVGAPGSIIREDARGSARRGESVLSLGEKKGKWAVRTKKKDAERQRGTCTIRPDRLQAQHTTMQSEDNFSKHNFAIEGSLLEEDEEGNDEIRPQVQMERPRLIAPCTTSVPVMA